MSRGIKSSVRKRMRAKNVQNRTRNVQKPDNPCKAYTCTCTATLIVQQRYTSNSAESRPIKNLLLIRVRESLIENNILPEIGGVELFVITSFFAFVDSM